jgi:hypothetical protein
MCHYLLDVRKLEDFNGIEGLRGEVPDAASALLFSVNISVDWNAFGATAVHESVRLSTD